MYLLSNTIVPNQMNNFCSSFSPAITPYWSNLERQQSNSSSSSYGSSGYFGSSGSSGSSGSYGYSNNSSNFKSSGYYKPEIKGAFNGSTGIKIW
jgi:hypothetical protein